MKNVHIVQKATGKIVATIPIEIPSMSHVPSKAEYEAAAWETAVDDGFVDRDRFSEYSFKVDDAATSGVGSPPAT